MCTISVGQHLVQASCLYITAFSACTVGSIDGNALGKGDTLCPNALYCEWSNTLTTATIFFIY